MMMNLFLLKWVSMMSLWNCREGFFRCRGLPACCHCCASLASLLPSLLLSRLLTRLRCHPVKLFLFHLEAYSLTRDYCCVFLSFCLCVLCASVSVFYVLLPRHCRRRRAWGYGLKRWLWLVMAGYEFLFGIRNQINTACRRPGRLLLGRRQRCSQCRPSHGNPNTPTP
jgi:hypothetical protein